MLDSIPGGETQAAAERLGEGRESLRVTAVSEEAAQARARVRRVVTIARAIPPQLRRVSSFRSHWAEAAEEANVANPRRSVYGVVNGSDCLEHEVEGPALRDSDGAAVSR